MKRTLAAALAAFLLLTASACAKSPAAASAQPASSSPAASQSSSPAASQSAQSSSAASSAARSVEVQTETTSDPQVTYQEVFYGDSVEETASYTFTVPQFTLATDAATQTINKFYTDIANNLIDYTKQTVYTKAMDLNAVGLLNGKPTVTVANGVITVQFDVTVEYKNTDQTESHTRTDTFDASTGACTGTTKS